MELQVSQRRARLLWEEVVRARRRDYEISKRTRPTYHPWQTWSAMGGGGGERACIAK